MNTLLAVNGTLMRGLSLHQNITSIAQRANVSTATVNRILDTIHFPKMMLPEALSIDEFKGNA